jgi:TonB family protein
MTVFRTILAFAILLCAGASWARDAGPKKAAAKNPVPVKTVSPAPEKATPVKAAPVKATAAKNPAKAGPVQDGGVDDGFRFSLYIESTRGFSTRRIPAATVVLHDWLRQGAGCFSPDPTGLLRLRLNADATGVLKQIHFLEGGGANFEDESFDPEKLNTCLMSAWGDRILEVPKRITSLNVKIHFDDPTDTVALAEAETGWGMDKVEADLKSNAPLFQACFEAGRKKRAGLKGRVIVEITIAPDGQVMGTRLKGTSLGHRFTEECLEEKIRGLRFAPLQTESPQRLSWPFVFAP